MKKPLRHSAERVKRIEQKIAKAPSFFSRHLNQLGLLSPDWNAHRDYVSYNHFFRKPLRIFFGSQSGSSWWQHVRGKGFVASTILEVLSMIPCSPKKPLEILEDGPGKGRFIQTLRRKLIENRVPVKTTAVAIHHIPELERLKESGELDALVVPKSASLGLPGAEFFVPDRPLDAIFSMFGSIHYTLPELRKDHLLKYAHALKPGGIMFAGFDTFTDVKKEPFPDIERSFAKQGFKAKFFNLHFGGRVFPDTILLVQRLPHSRP
ncbi:MAG: hypothetical protein HY917_00755 [Candidatus Diapherotrites archaeon]|nr:hypothetical protein [Candidatus Diapherotrites archaeon]